MSDAELPWYTDKGPFQDVVISSRIRLSRNLANFPFPANFHGDDSERVQSVVFDAFSKIDSEEENFSFSAVDARNMDEEGRNLFKEWGVIREIRASENIPPETGLVFQRKQALSLSARRLSLPAIRKWMRSGFLFLLKQVFQLFRSRRQIIQL